MYARVQVPDAAKEGVSRPRRVRQMSIKALEAAAATVQEDSDSDEDEFLSSCWCEAEDTSDMIGCTAKCACNGMVHRACEGLAPSGLIPDGFRCSRCIDLAQLDATDSEEESCTSSSEKDSDAGDSEYDGDEQSDKD